MMRPRIGIDVTAALTQGGGIGRYTRELVRALAIAGNGGYEYTFFSARPPAKLPVSHPLPQRANIRLRQAPLDERWLYRFWYRLRLPLPVQWLSGPLDLFHSPDFVLPPVSGSIPTLLTVHDLSFVHFPEAFTPALVNYLNKTVPWSVQRASHILADSQATRDDLMNLWNVPGGKITVLYSGVSSTFQPVTGQAPRMAVRHKYGLGDKPYLVSVGTLQPRKNYQMLIRAFRPVAARWPHNLVIAGGKGWLYDEMVAEVERQGLQGRVLFTGFVDDADLPALYSEATLFLFASLYEGFGLPPLEAMACGVPVLASNASCLPEVVGDAAVQLNPAEEIAWTEAMNYLLSHAGHRGRLIAAGFRHARRFTWQKAAGQLLELYHVLLADRRTIRLKNNMDIHTGDGNNTLKAPDGTQ
jgi:glycosyltransferase involved in cell wall biosynthesis